MDKAEKLQSLFGLDVNELSGHALEEPDYPDVVPGRVLHIDGDFLAYQVAADDEKSVDTMMHNHDVSTETLRLLAGAESTVSHLTAGHGDKGRRFDIAIQREYQVCRKGKSKPKQLYTIKSWMHKKRGAVDHEFQEADDGLCQANWAAVQAGVPELSVLVSKDKDLQMCQGVHLDWDTGELETVDGYGYVFLDRSKSSPKIVGKGPAFFWAQMLTGDTADSIQGLPFVQGAVLNAVKPTKATLAAQEVLKSTAGAVRAEKAQMTLDSRKPGKCGAVLAYELIKDIKTNKAAYGLVKGLYEQQGNAGGFVHWVTGAEATWQDVFVSEAKLLWMRRVPDEQDVLRYFKECQ